MVSDYSSKPSSSKDGPALPSQQTAVEFPPRIRFQTGDWIEIAIRAEDGIEDAMEDDDVYYAPAQVINVARTSSKDARWGVYDCRFLSRAQLDGVVITLKNAGSVWRVLSPFVQVCLLNVYILTRSLSLQPTVPCLIYS